MEDDDLNTPATAGTETMTATQDDTAEIDFDYFDPDEDGTPEVAEQPAPDEVDGEPEDTPEAETPEEPEAEPKRADATAKVTLADGTEVTVGELAKGHMRQSDYTRKTQEVAELRQRVEADASRIESITQAFVDHLSSMIPDEPDHGLALRDPAAYTRQKAQHDAALAQVRKLIELGSQPKEVKQAYSEADMQKQVAEESRLLAEAFPETATQEGKVKFWNEVSETAMELGFTAQELQQATDHRLFKLAHWARKGMAAEKAKAAAKAKAQAAPPVAPHKPGAGARAANGNAEAMRKLSRTGSLKDALAVDFD